jgi:hypothetical protein
VSEFILFWVAKHLVDMVAVLLVIGAALLITLRTVSRQSKCPHNGAVSETQACDAICRQCGKNLGFIGAWRERNSK